MNPNEVPTKGNLMRAKNTLALSRQGYDLMDKKRNILIRSLMQLIDESKDIQGQIDSTYRAAYAALQKANIEMGIHTVQAIAGDIPEDHSLEIKFRSVMGTEIPLVRDDDSQSKKPIYAFYRTRSSLDKAREAFEKVKKLTVELATVETSAYRLASEIKRTQKRANALKNITIPYYEQLTKSITNALEEKEREDFTRLKVIKRRKTG